MGSFNLFKNYSDLWNPPEIDAVSLTEEQKRKKQQEEFARLYEEQNPVSGALARYSDEIGDYLSDPETPTGLALGGLHKGLEGIATGLNKFTSGVAGVPEQDFGRTVRGAFSPSEEHGLLGSAIPGAGEGGGLPLDIDPVEAPEAVKTLATKAIQAGTDPGQLAFMAGGPIGAVAGATLAPGMIKHGGESIGRGLSEGGETGLADIASGVFDVGMGGLGIKHPIEAGGSALAEAFPNPLKRPIEATRPDNWMSEHDLNVGMEHALDPGLSFREQMRKQQDPNYETVAEKFKREQQEKMDAGEVPIYLEDYLSVGKPSSERGALDLGSEGLKKLNAFEDSQYRKYGADWRAKQNQYERIYHESLIKKRDLEVSPPPVEAPDPVTRKSELNRQLIELTAQIRAGSTPELESAYDSIISELSSLEKQINPNYKPVGADLLVEPPIDPNTQAELNKLKDLTSSFTEFASTTGSKYRQIAEEASRPTEPIETTPISAETIPVEPPTPEALPAEPMVEAPKGVTREDLAKVIDPDTANRVLELVNQGHDLERATRIARAEAQELEMGPESLTPEDLETLMAADVKAEGEIPVDPRTIVPDDVPSPGIEAIPVVEPLIGTDEPMAAEPIRGAGRPKKSDQSKPVTLKPEDIAGEVDPLPEGVEGDISSAEIALIDKISNAQSAEEIASLKDEAKQLGLENKLTLALKKAQFKEKRATEAQDVRRMQEAYNLKRQMEKVQMRERDKLAKPVTLRPEDIVAEAEPLPEGVESNISSEEINLIDKIDRAQTAEELSSLKDEARQFGQEQKLEQALKKAQFREKRAQEAEDVRRMQRALRLKRQMQKVQMRERDKAASAMKPKDLERPEILESDNMRQTWAKMTPAEKLRAPLDLFKSLRAAVDTPVLRQGKNFTYDMLFNDPRALWDSLKSMKNQAFSEAEFKSVQEGLMQDPNIKAGVEKFKLDLPGVGKALKEEAFHGGITEKIPVIKSIVRPSDRAYTSFLNAARVWKFNDIVGKLKEAGYDINNPAHAKAFEEAAKAVNIAGARGHFSNKTASNLNNLSSLLWSPRNRLAKGQLIGEYLKASTGLGEQMHPVVAKELVKGFNRVAGVNLSLLGLAALSGAAVSLDPNSTDFLRAKLGNTVWDPWFGLQPIVRGIARSATGTSVSSSGREAKTDIVNETKNYLASGAAPGPNLLFEQYYGHTTTGYEKDRLRSAAESITPMVISSLYDQMEAAGVFDGSMNGEKVGETLAAAPFTFMGESIDTRGGGKKVSTGTPISAGVGSKKKGKKKYAF